MKLPYLPPIESQHGHKVDDLTLYVHLLMIALFVGWSLYFLYAIWRFRKGRNPKADYVGTTAHTSSAVEVAVALVEGVLLFGLAIPMWANSVDKFPDPKASTVLRITGRQFNWVARYPGADGVFGKQDVGLVTGDNPMGLIAKDPKLKNTDTNGFDDVLLESGEIAVPVNKVVHLLITSNDVIHSWTIPSFGSKQQAVPGRVTATWFQATREGVYYGQCSVLCGRNHSAMPIAVRVVKDDVFAAWVAAIKDRKPKEARKLLLAATAGIEPRTFAELPGHLTADGLTAGAAPTDAAN